MRLELFLKGKCVETLGEKQKGKQLLHLHGYYSDLDHTVNKILSCYQHDV